MVRREEIAAAKVARAAIATLAVSAASRQATIRTLRKANRIATLAIPRGFSDEKHLIDARHNAEIALSELIHALEKLFPPQEKIDKAKQAVEVWIEALTLKPKLYRISRMRATPAEFIGEAEDEEQDWRSRTPPRYATSSLHAVTNFRV
jgi:hypothetical protein